MLQEAVFLYFIDNWKLLHPDSKLHYKLKDFIEAWNFCAEPQISDQTLVTELNSSVLNDFVADIAPMLRTIKAERSNGDSVNVWEVAGLGHDEVRICSVFAWFLNCHADHGQGSALLSGVIDKVRNKPDLFPIAETIQSKPYWVYPESCAAGEQSSRIDIEIDGENFLLFIEVKIFAGETNNQLERYLKIAEKKAGNRRWGIIYLTPTGKKASIQHPMLLPISWNDIAKVFQNHAQYNLPAQSYSSKLISQFSKHILKF